MIAALKKVCGLFLILASVMLGMPLGVSAATYSALRLTTTGGGVVAMAPGEVKNIAVTFQNTGTETWKNDGTGYISLYTYNPKYRVSAFDPGTWLSPSQIKRISETSVKPGGTGSLFFGLKAPQTEGTYKETFHLAAENLAWVTGGEFTLTITVKKPSSTTSTSTSSSSGSTNVSQTASTDGYSAQVTMLTANRLKLTAGKTVPLAAVIKNTGTKTWNSLGLSSAGLSLASASSISFANSTWDGTQVALTPGAVAPGSTGTVQFYLTAPKVNGTHTAKFQITADDVSVPDAFVEIPVEVTGGAGEAIDAPTNENDSPTIAYIDEPIIRVGVLIVDEETDNEIYVTSYESDFELRDTEGNTLGTYSSGAKVRAAYEGGRYAYKDDSGSHTSSKPLRFVPKTANAVMTITNFDRRVTRDTQYANNTFRNVLEIRYNGTKDRTWVINELPMEYYLRGLAETSNVSPLEFQKALLTAARTYAFYHWTRATKHAAEGFHVDAYRDQVYWGYGQEERTPRITQAVEETRGQIVTYNGNTAITAYFSRSDGRTRDWSEVWGGDVPWSKSVPVPCDVGRTLWGHGVGMSASGALCMANDGKNWKEILKYFYTGIDLTKRWK